MASISIESVSRRFADGTRALDAVSLAVVDGECLALVGPSGCGKSTLLRAVAGLEPLDAGRVLIGGVDVGTRAPAERDVAMVFQNYALYPQMTVRENLEFGLKSRGMAARERSARVAEVAGLLGLETLLDRRPSELSGGQLQRVAMGRAIARRPQAFLMDEPLSNLDSQLRASMRAELARMRERLGVTTLYVTHDQVEAMTLGQRVAVLRDGTLQQCDTPRKIYDAPCNTFVASFIGSPPMNLLPARRDGRSLRFGGFSLPLNEAGGEPRIPMETVTIGLRPGDFAADRHAPGDWPRLEVVTHAVEEFGHECILRFRPGEPPGTEPPVELTALLGGRDTIAPGERLRLAVDTAHLHFFDPRSGQALA